MIEFDGRTENLRKAESGAEAVGQSKMSWLDFDFVSDERYRESQYGQKLINRFASLSISTIKGKGRSYLDDIGICI
jgi:hypothetical protein